ncbi:MAG: GNAT family N-acetyltransferase [Lachnospiraceae bacterium]|jgi:putative acetyltransferase|nr:GNAT family N-acetyltransferase [Lachnospiraceae bacterium]
MREDSAAIAALVRTNLKAHGLDIPGTVCFDPNLDNISDFYLEAPDKRYYMVVISDDDRIIGGIGLAEFNAFSETAELQKLYLSDEAKGRHLSYEMIGMIEEKARTLGYRQMYLETHTNLKAAIHIYEKTGYSRISRPESVVHGGMNRFYLKKL